MPRPATRIQTHVHPADSNIKLMLGRRSDSKRWEAHITLPTGREVIRSTGETEFEKAKVASYVLYLKLRDDIAAGRGISTHLFKEAAEKVAKDMDVQVALLKEAAPHTRKHHRALKHATCIRGCLIPALGDLPITGLTREVLDTYVEQRTGRNGKPAAASTILNHNHSLQKVLAYARKKGWITNAQQYCLIASAARGAEPRATFEAREYSKMINFMTDEWISKARTAMGSETRAILREYVIIAAATGVRPGTELDQVPWSAVDTDWYNEFGTGPYVVISISRRSGKTARSRYVVAYQGEAQSVRDALKRLRALNPTASASTPIFARPSSGTPPGDFHGAFESLLNEPELDLLRDRDGDRRSPYSLRHFYACSMLLRGLSYETLEKQMGTSAKMLSDYYSSRVTALAQADRLAGLPPKTQTALMQTPLGADTSDLELFFEPPGSDSPRLLLQPNGTLAFDRTSAFNARS